MNSPSTKLPKAQKKLILPEPKVFVNAIQSAMMAQIKNSTVP